MSEIGRRDTAATEPPRQWEVAALRWSRVAPLLDDGWEPFAVVQREPNSKTTTTEATVYLRRERPSRV